MITRLIELLAEICERRAIGEDAARWQRYVRVLDDATVELAE